MILTAKVKLFVQEECEIGTLVLHNNSFTISGHKPLNTLNVSVASCRISLWLYFGSNILDILDVSIGLVRYREVSSREKCQLRPKIDVCCREVSAIKCPRHRSFVMRA